MSRCPSCRQQGFNSMAGCLSCGYGQESPFIRASDPLATARQEGIREGMERAAKVVESFARVTKPRPTIKELEDILTSEGGEVVILPDGEVRSSGFLERIAKAIRDQMEQQP